MILGILFGAMAVAVTYAFVRIVTRQRARYERPPLTRTDIDTFALELALCDELAAVAEQESG